ncbi:hypothetical protein N0V88_000734 [Collariella sp. IMI 366227]|nr:hypothetical protein N0V88_000734 [Collariella sp. IMI 366227]
MRHNPKWATFNSVYINEKVGFHLQNAFLDKPTEDSLLAMLSHIGLMRDPRASKDIVPDEVWEMMPPDPQLAALEAERAQLKGGQYRIKGIKNENRVRELTKLIATKKAQRKNAIRRAYREDYFYNRPTWDIEADGQEEEYVELTIDLHISERAQLAEILCNQPDNLSSAELLELRIQAAELMVILPDRIRQRARAEVQADVTVKEESPGMDPFPLLMDRKQCPRCVGDETLSREERTFKYCRPAVMFDHFDRKHARELGHAKRMLCNHPNPADLIHTFKCVKDKAESQLTCRYNNNCDAETTALQIAWLNDCYRDQGVYFALLGAQGLDLEAFPAPQVKKTFLFRQHQGIWSVAYVKRRPDQVIMFNGTSEKPSDHLDKDKTYSATSCLA